jgi:fructokinase
LAWTLAQLCHVVVCAAAPRRIVIGGGVMERQPHLLPRIEAMLRESIADYVSIPSEEPYVQAPALGAGAGQLGPIALRLMS